MEVTIICAGFGGQGVLTAGMLIASIANDEGKKITWFPSYGAEMRGGTANCTVKVSDEPIGSPMASGLDIAFTMNAQAIDKFEASIRPGGYLFVNSTIVDPDRTYRDDIHVVKVAASETAAQLQNAKGANLVMLGAVATTTGLFGKDELESGMCRYFESKGKGKYNEKNLEALRAGYID